jgi:glycosyltransferase involved in cell wall biosynthesis
VKIAMIGQKGIPALYGGIERHVEEIARRLVLRGHEVSVYCRLHYTPTGGRYHGVELIRLPSINTKHLDTITHVALSTAHALTRDFDVLHFHALGPSLFAAPPRVLGRPTVVTVHGLDWQREKWGKFAQWALKQCEGPAVRFPDRTIVVSKTLREHFASHFGRDTVTIPNGTVLPEPRPAHKIHKHGLEAGKYVLFVGRLVPEKGVHFLCEAWSRLDTDLTLAICGGASASEDYVRDIRRFVGPRVRMLDYVYGEMLEELYSNAYAVVLPSTVEGLSLVLLEALSHGRCVLVSDIPENLEVTLDAAPSFRSRDVDDLAAQLGRLLAEPALVRRYEERARSHITAHYSWDRVVDATIEVYAEVVAARRGRGTMVRKG